MIKPGNPFWIALLALAFAAPFARAADSCQDAFRESVDGELSVTKHPITEVGQKYRIDLEKLEALIIKTQTRSRALARGNIQTGEEFKLAEALPLPLFHLEGKPSAHTTGDTNPPLSLSLENGRQALDALKLHFVSPDNKYELTMLTDYMRVLNQLPNLKLIIAVAPLNLDFIKKFIAQQPREIRPRIQLLAAEVGIDQWPQDSSKPVDLPYATLDIQNPRYQKTVQELRRSALLTWHDLPERASFEGGDIIVGDQSLIIGMTTLTRFAEEHAITDNAEAADEIATIFNKKVNVVGLLGPVAKKFVRPWSFHIDLDMTLAVDHRTDSEVALVQSPELLLKTLAPDAQFSEIPTDDEILTAELSIVRRFRADFDQTGRVTTGLIDFVRFMENKPPHAIRFEIYQSRLFRKSVVASGFKVIDLPGIGILENAHYEREMFFGTNAILSNKTAIIPNNLLPPLDEKIQQIYRSLGYDVIPMNSSALSIYDHGGIRCLTETFRKSYLPVPSRER